LKKIKNRKKKYKKNVLTGKRKLKYKKNWKKKETTFLFYVLKFVICFGG